ncbi:MAG: hypothetical protein IJ558_10020 [Treponema sp.]|nr:hypothetical protein [Treponema sp.]
MSENELNGIKRQLIIRYLAENSGQGVGKKDFSMTVTPVEKKEAAVFPAALKREQMTILEQGIILVKNPSATLAAFIGSSVRVQFYFNKLGLYFITEVTSSSSGVALFIPETLYRVSDTKSTKKNGFSVLVYYETGTAVSASDKKEPKINAECFFDDDFALFERVDWNEVVQKYLANEQLVQNKNAESVENRAHAPTVIYLDAERIVFAAKKSDMMLKSECEYALALRFPLPGPLKERRVFTTCFVEDVSESYDRTRLCANARFTSLKEEDERFLSEKMS